MRPYRKPQGAPAEVLFDDCDREVVLSRRWYIGSHGYVTCRASKGVYLLLHREVTQAPRGVEVDHINRNRLDNRRVNLRFATRQQNANNRGANPANPSGYRGVTRAPKGLRLPWLARARPEGRYQHLGTYADRMLAAAIAATWRALNMPGSS